MLYLVSLQSEIIKYNTMMDDAIKDLSETLLANELKLLSWGISDIRISDGSLRFDVKGMKYCGTVIVCVHGGECIVRLGSREVRASLKDIADVLDREIEVTDDYHSDLARWLRNDDQSKEG